MTLDKNIVGWFSAAALLLTAACSGNPDMNLPEDDIPAGKTVVTLTVRPENQSTISRAGESPESYPKISDGTKADLLIYAVYDKNADGSYTLAEEFGGQKRITDAVFPMTIQFIIDKDAEYTVAFWAQNSTTDAFDTSDLQKVKVIYENAKNNDELRDAFCVTETINGSINDKTITLHRPLAQVNVGAPGWDYEAAAILHPNPRTYAKSTVTFSGLAQYYNVVEAKTLTQDELEDGELAMTTGDVVFATDIMPAFLNLDNDDWNALSYLPYDKAYNEAFTSDVAKENFLIIDIDKDENFKPYYHWGDYNTVNNPKTLNDTETFKYLSMTYILVPVAKDETGNVKVASLSKVKFSASEADGSNEREFFTISNVPVQQNWRTNIISNNIFLVDATFHLFIVPTYCGDYNDINGNNNGESKNDWNVDVKEDENGNWSVLNPGNTAKNPKWGGYNDNYPGIYTPEEPAE